MRRPGRTVPLNGRDLVLFQYRGVAIGVLALVGTRKGLFLLHGDDDRRQWRAEGPLLAGWGIYHATVDHTVYGPTVARRRLIRKRSG